MSRDWRKSVGIGLRLHYFSYKYAVEVLLALEKYLISALLVPPGINAYCLSTLSN